MGFKNEYLGRQFKLHYNSVVKRGQKLRILGPAAFIFKVDISLGLRHTPIDHADIDLLGLK